MISMKNIITMIIRLTCLTSALTLAAASKSAKTPRTPTPTDASKAAKSTSPIASKSSKSKTSDEYFIAPFSCPQKCISAHGYEASNHLLEDAVSECDASDSYQKWKVHQVGAFLKFESAAKYDHNMCLAVVHQDPDHVTNTPGLRYVITPSGSIPSSLYPLNESGSQLGGTDAPPSVFLQLGGALGMSGGGSKGAYEAGALYAVIDSGTSLLLSENDVDGICNDGKLGLAHCNHPGSNWYSTGGNFLSAFLLES